MELASFITDLTELRDLGVRVLGLSLRKVNAAHNNALKNVNEAACNILEEWRRKQKSSHEAFTKICTNLKKVGWNQMAFELEHPGEASSEESGLTPQSKTIFSKVVSHERGCHWSRYLSN